MYCGYMENSSEKLLTWWCEKRHDT